MKRGRLDPRPLRCGHKPGDFLQPDMIVILEQSLPLNQILSVFVTSCPIRATSKQQGLNVR